MGNRFQREVSAYKEGDAGWTVHTTNYDYDDTGNLQQMETPEGTLNYGYLERTNRKESTWTGDTTTQYSYDHLGRLDSVTLTERDGAAVSEVTGYGYTDLGSRKVMDLPNGVSSRYQYNNLARLTELTQKSPGDTWASYSYKLAPDGMRVGLDEVQVQPDTTTEDHSITYEYDNLNRLTREHSDDNITAGQGYTIDYEYDLTGNRTERVVAVGAQELTTTYTYDANDHLLEEEHVGPVSAARIGDEPIYAYADGNGGLRYRLAGHDGYIGQVGAFFRGLPSKVWIYINIMALASIPLCLFAPLMAQLFRKLSFPRRRESREEDRFCAQHGMTRPSHPTFGHWTRGIAAMLAIIFLIGPGSFEVMAQQTSLYSDLATTDWAEGNRTITYEYDDNGSVIQKTTTASAVELEVIDYQYNLQNRLSKVITDPDPASSTNIVDHVEYTYNVNGIRVQSYTYKQPQNGGAKSNEETTTYLIDSANHTGYAQPLEEWTDNGVVPDITYTIGDDVISQSKLGAVHHLLCDGHGSTRQLSNSSGDITDCYSYDAYGVMLGGNPTSANPPTTNLLYSGEHFDTNIGQQYLRARYYDQNNGRFNRMDPYSGNSQDPQSLHKYAYCHNNPVNGIDPTGQIYISLVVRLSTYALMTAAIVPHIITIGRSFKGLLDLSGFSSIVRGLAVSGVLDFMEAKAIQEEAFLAAKEIISDIIGATKELAKEIAMQYAFGLALGAVTKVAMKAAGGAVGLAKSGQFTIAIAGRAEIHHTIFKCAVKPFKRQRLFRLQHSQHVGKPNGLHYRISQSERFSKLQPTSNRSMRSIHRNMGRQPWLDELGECYKWLEKTWPGDYKGIYKCYQESVKKIGGVSGLK